MKRIFKGRRFFDEHLKEALKNPKVNKAYEEAELPIRLAIEIARLREKKGLTQHELAKKIGTKQQVVSRIEKLGENFTIGTLQRIAHALDAHLFVSMR
ncbi:MAG: helix-turn-helix domain-containing protein [Elusimicrobia bacterium]|nr:helix-turn-helix domain-containing protein [Elusimicrobiota bacterium]